MNSSPIACSCRDCNQEATHTHVSRRTLHFVTSPAAPIVVHRHLTLAPPLLFSLRKSAWGMHRSLCLPIHLSSGIWLRAANLKLDNKPVLWRMSKLSGWNLHKFYIHYMGFISNEKIEQLQDEQDKSSKNRQKQCNGGSRMKSGHIFGLHV